MLDADIQAMTEYCLNCKNKPCSNEGCPIHTPIPEFIASIKNENIDYAFKMLTDNNIFSDICSTICPQEKQCESKCVRGIKGEPVAIGRLERFVNRMAKEDHIVFAREKAESIEKKVAIIGAGPAGLECAYELLLEGFEVDIYEKEEMAGGILRYGIPNFRLRKNKIDKIVKQIENLGANFHYNTRLGKDVSIKSLKKKYDYIFVAVGISKPLTYKLSEENLKEVYLPNKFLRAYSDNNYIEDLGTVSVIGGGNVAMDCARVALKMGADKVKILYRRDKEHMPACEKELKDAIAEGVEFKECVRVDSANLENGKVVTLNCAQTEIIDGRAVDKNDAELYTEKTDTVVFAIGLKPNKKLLEDQGIKVNDKGYIIVDENGMTNIENVYAGGDLTEDDATVCYAIASGKKVAKAIIKKEKE